MESKLHNTTNKGAPGQGMVEFALVLTLLLMVVIGVLEVGRLMFIYGSVTTAAREAARYASAVGVNDGGVQHFLDCDGIRAAAKKVGFLQNFNDGDIHITYDRGVNGSGDPVAIVIPGGGEIDPDPSADSCPISQPSVLRNDDRVVVQVSLLYSPIVPFIPLEPFEIKATNARTVIVNVDVEVTAAPQGWNPSRTDTPTSTATTTQTGTATQTSTTTMTSTVTHTPTVTLTPTKTLTVTPGPSPTPTSTITLTPTATPLPSCNNLQVINARFNDDNFEVQVQNDNVAPAYLISSKLDWDTTYAPVMYFNEASFGPLYYQTDYFTSPINMAAPSLVLNGFGATQWWVADFNNNGLNWKDGYYGVDLTFSFPNWGNCSISAVKSLYTPTPSFTPTATSTRVPTRTPTLTATAVNCMLVAHGTLSEPGSTMQMSINNGTGAPLTISQITVYWNHDDGHTGGGNDKTLRLQKVSLGSEFWSGDIYAPSYTINPTFLTLPAGSSTIIFTFSQSYDKTDHTERIVILLSSNGCQNYSIDSSK